MSCISPLHFCKAKFAIEIRKHATLDLPCLWKRCPPKNSPRLSQRIRNRCEVFVGTLTHVKSRASGSVVTMRLDGAQPDVLKSLGRGSGRAEVGAGTGRGRGAGRGGRAGTSMSWSTSVASTHSKAMTAPVSGRIRLIEKLQLNCLDS